MSDRNVLKQILLITDGCSNEGTDPVHIALLAARQGVSVSVIGILDDGALGFRGEQEIIRIAAAGGGMYRLSKLTDLAHTAQILTQRTMEASLQKAVLSKWGMNTSMPLVAIPPELRPQLAREVQIATEFVILDLCLVIDMSGSMNPKRAALREAVKELAGALSVRAGGDHLEVVVFPDPKGKAAKQLKVPLPQLADVIWHMEAQGNTPTGPALALALTILKPRANETGHAGGLVTDVG